MVSSSEGSLPPGWLPPPRNYECKNCVYCGIHPAKLDTRCGSVYYCSNECQTADWPSHKLLCKAYADQADRPSPLHRRAILFPEDNASPKMIWIKCDLADSTIPKEVAGFLECDPESMSRQRIQKNPRLDRRTLLNTVEIIFLEDRMLDATRRPNKSIDRILGNSIFRPQEWRGSIVALRKRGLDLEPKLYEDITLVEYRHAVDHFATFGYTAMDKKPRAKPTRERMNGVKVNCAGEQALYQVDTFSPVEVPSHSLERYGYTIGQISPISKLIGIPIRAWKCPTKEPPNGPANYDRDNIPATLIFMNPDPKSAEFGWSPAYWQSDLGNVLLVREDGQDLDVNLAETFCRWCEWKLYPQFEAAMGLFGNEKTHRLQVTSQITRENMEAYAVELEDRSVDTPSPPVVGASETPETLVTLIGPEEAGPDVEFMLKQMRDAHRSDKEYGQAILELADEEQDEYDLSYI